MADMVGKNYATGEPVTVAVDENGVVQVATAAAAAASTQQLQDDIAEIKATLHNIKTKVEAL